MHKVLIHWTNGFTTSIRPFKYFDSAMHYCRNLSFSGDKIRRVEIDSTAVGGGIRAIYDITWDDESKATGLAFGP